MQTDLCNGSISIDQFRYIKIQSNTIDLRTRLWGNSTNSVFIPQSLVLRSFVIGWILRYRSWSILESLNSRQPARESKCYACAKMWLCSFKLVQSQWQVILFEVEIGRAETIFHALPNDDFICWEMFCVNWQQSNKIALVNFRLSQFTTFNFVLPPTLKHAYFPPIRERGAMFFLFD